MIIQESKSKLARAACPPDNRERRPIPGSGIIWAAIYGFCLVLLLLVVHAAATKGV